MDGEAIPAGSYDCKTTFSILSLISSVSKIAKKSLVTVGDDDGDDEGGDDDDEYEDGDDQWAPARRRTAAAVPSRDELRLLSECLKLTAGIKRGTDVTAYFRDVRESLYPAGDLVLASWDSSVATALESQQVFLKRETATVTIRANHSLPADGDL